MSGWLVMWGPLIIVGFLILVFMGNEREPATVAVAPEASQPEPAAAEAEAETPAVESGLDISPEKAAADLAEAFKAAGLPVPESATAGAAAATSGEAELPPEMKANPWAPQPGQAEEVPVAPPPPGYGQYPYGAYPPPMGYGYGARPGYGWGPPPGYGYGYGGMMPPAGMGGPMGGQMRGYGRGYGGYRMPHEGMPHEGMPHEGMPHEGMPYPGMPHPGMMPDHGGQQSGDSSAPPPPSDAAQPGNN